MNAIIKKLTKKVVAVALASTLVLVGFSFNYVDAAGTRPGFDPKKVGGSMVFATFSDATRLIPYTTSDSVSNDLQSLMFDSLVDTDPKTLEPIPSVATRWEVSKDGLQYTFYMRKDVKFHDGKPLTAHDVVFSQQIYMNPESINPYRSNFEDVAKVEALDDYTVRFTLKKKNVLWMYGSPPHAAILAKHQFPKGVEDFNNNTKIHRNPIGSGPFKFKEWKTAERIVLEANKDYWKGRPYLDQIIMRVLPDSNVEVLNLLKGTIDFLEVIQPKSVTQVTKDKDLKVLKYNVARFDFIGWNTQNPKFKDKAVRQALAYGLNRQAIIDKIMLKNATLAVSNFMPDSPFHNPGLKPLPYDVKKANQILDQAGWKLNKDGIREKNGVKLEFELAYNNGNKIRESVAAAAQQDWKKLGVKATPRSYDFSIMLERADKGELDAWVLAVSLGPDPDQSNLYATKDIPTAQNDFNGFNSNRISDPRLDELLDKFTQEPDAKKRIAMYQEVERIAADNQYYLFTYHPAQFTAFNKKLIGPNPTPYSWQYNIIDWYWQK